MKLIRALTTIGFRPILSPSLPQSGVIMAATAGVIPTLTPVHTAIAPTLVTPRTRKYKGKNGMTRVKPADPMKVATVRAV
jgi:hypothetical protein